MAHPSSRIGPSVRIGRDRSDSDPISNALRPPPNESPQDREQRLRAEEDARRRSENIDRILRHDEKRSRRRKTVKVLLLGQSESGKSTTLKREFSPVFIPARICASHAPMFHPAVRQSYSRPRTRAIQPLQGSLGREFQLLHDPAAFHRERLAWRFVIYLNLVRSIRRILEAIAPEDTTGADDEDFGESTETASIIISGSDRPSSSLNNSQPNYEQYRTRLAPLMDLEQRLIAILSDPDDEGEREATHLPESSGWTDSRSNFSVGSPLSTSHTLVAGRPPRIAIPPASASHPSAASSYPSSSYASSSSFPSTSYSSHSTALTSPRSPTSPAMSFVSSTHEISVRNGWNWKKPFVLGRMQSPKSPHGGELVGWWEDPSDPVHTLNRHAPLLNELWRDPKVQARLSEKQIRLQESSGFYLEEIDRITAKMYFPTDDDVLKARLKTTGVVEHKFTLSKNTEFSGVEWIIYDVGGSQNQRQAWAPYFDDVNAIIFLVPISAFDQQLAEDSRVNRLEDSFLLWKSVIENKLLARVNIVLFLNKCDLLKKKLESGVRLHHYMPSFNRPNDYETVSQYFRNRFGAMHEALTPNKERECFIHLTSVTDTRKTHTIISNVRDIILTANLKSSSLM